MEINLPPPTPIPPQQLQSLVRNWQVGQVVQATVAKQPSSQSAILQIGNLQIQAVTSAPLPPGQQITAEIIKLGNRPILQLQLPSTTIGQTQTTSTSMTSVRIELLPATAVATRATTATTPASQATPPSQPQSSPIEQALKLALPKQASMSPLMANIAWISSGKGTTLTLPPLITQISKELLNALPDKNRIAQPGVMRQAILDSGVFLENKLTKLPPETMARDIKQLLTETSRQAKPESEAQTGKQASTADKLGNDVKLALIKMIGTIRQVSATPQTQARPTQPATSERLPELPFTPPTLPQGHPKPQRTPAPSLIVVSNVLQALQELGKQAEASLARTQLHQIASTPTPDNNPQWALELPIRNNNQIDIFDMVIEDEQSRDEDDQPQHRWSIMLAFDLPGLGPVHAKLQLIDNKVNTTFWAEHPQTSRLFNEHIEELRRRFRDSGIEAAELRCIEGTPPPSQAGKQPHVVLDVNV